MPTLVVVPDGNNATRPAPAVAVLHQHVGEWQLSKTEPAGPAGNPVHHAGVALTRKGYVVICPHAVCFEERRSPHLEDGNFERFEFLRHAVAGRSRAWKNILRMWRAIDYLVSRSDDDATRIGSSNQVWVTCLHQPCGQARGIIFGVTCEPRSALVCARTALVAAKPQALPHDDDACRGEPPADLARPEVVANHGRRLDHGSEPPQGHAGVTDDAAGRHLDRVNVEEPATADCTIHGHRPHEHVGHAGSAHNTVDRLAYRDPLPPVAQVSPRGDFSTSLRSTIRSLPGVLPVWRWRNVVIYCTDLKPARAEIVFNGMSVCVISLPIAATRSRTDSS